MKTTKIIRQTKNNTKLHDYPNIGRERVWRSTQRINLQSQRGRSIPNTGYTTINITIPLQYFLRPDLQVQQALTYAIQLIASPPVITQNQRIQNVTHDLTGSPGQTCPLHIRRNRIGNGGPYRTHRSRRRECDE